MAVAPWQARDAEDVRQAVDRVAADVPACATRGGREAAGHALGEKGCVIVGRGSVCGVGVRGCQLVVSNLGSSASATSYPPWACGPVRGRPGWHPWARVQCATGTRAPQVRQPSAVPSRSRGISTYPDQWHQEPCAIKVKGGLVCWFGILSPLATSHIKGRVLEPCH